MAENIEYILYLIDKMKKIIQEYSFPVYSIHVKTSTGGKIEIPLEQSVLLNDFVQNKLPLKNVTKRRKGHALMIMNYNKFMEFWRLLNELENTLTSVFYDKFNVMLLGIKTVETSKGKEEVRVSKMRFLI